MKFEQLKTLVHEWAENRELYKKATISKQIEKLEEEYFEVVEAFQMNSVKEEMLEIGDMLVVIINICQMRGYAPEMCLEQAYNKIATRTGKMINGTFVKDAH